MTNNNNALRPHNGPTLSFGVGSDEEKGSVTDVPSRTNQVVYHRVSFTTGASLPTSLGLSTYDFGTPVIFFGKPIGQNEFDILTFNGFGVGVLNSAITVQPNTTYLLVSKVDYVNNRLSLFINPTLGGAEPATPTAFINGYTTNNFSTGVSLSSGIGDAVTWDDLVSATSWAELGTVVTTTADEDNLTLGGGAGVSLREAVKYSPTGSLITFAPGLSGQTLTLTHADGDMEIPGALTIDATALPGGITVSGNNATRHFFVGSGNSLTLRNLTLARGNRAGGVGGSIANTGTLRLFRCTLTGNIAVFGGALASAAAGVLQCEDCTIAENVADAEGGGIYLSGGTAKLNRCTLSGNSANDGGALMQPGTVTTTLGNSTVAGNRSTGGSSTGGITVRSGDFNLEFCTVSQNFGNGGGGGLLLQTPATVNVHSSIIAGNTNPSGGPADINKISGTLNSSGANLIGSNESVATQFPASPSPGTPNAFGDYVGAAAAPLNAKLSPLGSFGGPVQTMHPLIGSPAIDTAGPADPADPGGTDARGFPGFVDGDSASAGAQYDIGAVEAGPLLTVTNNTASGSNTLRERISLGALTTTGARIGFSPSTFPAQTITLGGTELAIPATPGLFIDASNLTAPVTISGNNQSRVFNIPATATVAMHSVRIVNGNTPFNENGSGIANFGTCTVLASTLSGNSTSLLGGAISNFGTCMVLSSTLNGNSAGAGGGGIYNVGTCRVLSTTLSGNSAFLGGGIYNGTTGTCTVLYSTISGNAATNQSGGIHVFGTFNLTSSIVAGNTAPSNANISGTLATDTNNLTAAAPLADYGGPTQTMALRPGSPARNAATTSNRTTDQRGFPIVGTPDLGAYEAGTLTNFANFIWETLPATATEPQHAATADFDGDGATNLNEYLAGTVVTNPASVLRVLTFTRSGNFVNVAFPTVVGRNYLIEFTDTLSATPAWTPLALTVTGNGSVQTFPIGPIDGFTKFFLRIRVGP